jgi:CheY-like chemotaxis protein
MEAKRILVIEDNVLNRKLLRALLTIGGYQILEAGDAESGIQLARSHNPHLVLMDIQLPGMDGWRATQIMKGDPLLAGIPVVALTSSAMRGDEKRSLEAGCAGHISKPIDTASFLDTIAHYLR